MCLFPTTVPAAVWLFYRRPKHTTDDTTTTTTRDTKPGSFAIARPVPRVEYVGSAHLAGLRCSSRARARSCGVSRREAHGRLKHKPPQRRSEMWLGMRDVPRGTGSVLSCSMVVLTTPRRLPWPNRVGSTRNFHNKSIQPFVRTRSPTPAERCQPVVVF